MLLITLIMPHCYRRAPENCNLELLPNKHIIGLLVLNPQSKKKKESAALRTLKRCWLAHAGWRHASTLSFPSLGKSSVVLSVEPLRVDGRRCRPERRRRTTASAFCSQISSVRCPLQHHKPSRSSGQANAVVQAGTRGTAQHQHQQPPRVPKNSEYWKVPAHIRQEDRRQRGPETVEKVRVSEEA